MKNVETKLSSTVSSPLEHLPRPFINWLERVKIINNQSELPPDVNRPQLIFPELEKVYLERGLVGVQQVKHEYLRRLITFRTNKGVGLSMKARAQLILQEPLGLDGHSLGDPSTWILDPFDTKSCLAVVKFLTEIQVRSNIWVGFAMTSDWTDPISTHKNNRPPIIGRNDAINSVHDFRRQLSAIKHVIFEERVTKIARKLARFASTQYKSLNTHDRNALIKAQRPLAKTFLNHAIDNGNWHLLNDQLATLDQEPLEQEDHGLIKIFAQENNPRRQIADLIVSKDELTIDIPQDRLTSRQDEHTGNNIPTSLTIKKVPGCKPIIAYSNKEALAYLPPLLNSTAFFQLFDTAILPKLGNSPYHQVQFMIEQPLNSSFDPGSFKDIEHGHVAFITDVISGIHEVNVRDLNGNDNTISRFLSDINPDNLATSAVLIQKDLVSLVPNYPNELYHFLKRSARLSSFSDSDRQLASNLLAIYDGWQGKLHLPPSTETALENIALGRKPNAIPWRTLLILEEQQDTDGMIR